MAKTLYTILGIPESATEVDITRAYQTRLAALAPEDQISRIAATEAWNTLSNRQRRQRYDARLHDPRLAHALADHAPEDIGGWLALFAAGTFLFLFIQMIGILPHYTALFYQLTAPVQSPNSMQMIAAKFLSLALCAVLLGLTLCTLIALYSRSHRAVPTTLSLLVASPILLLIANLTLYYTHLLPEDIDSTLDNAYLFGCLLFPAVTLLMAFIWIPYFCFSRRVKATFPRRTPPPGPGLRASATPPAPPAEPPLPTRFDMPD